MKIDSAYKANLAAIPQRSLTRAAGMPAAESVAVNLSSVAGAMQSEEKSPLNAARVQEIKDAIAQGRFKINPEAIADGLLEAARDLINNQRRA